MNHVWVHLNKIKTETLLVGTKSASLLLEMAEREGFEPPEQLPVHRISSAARSTTPASFLVHCSKLST